MFSCVVSTSSNVAMKIKPSVGEMVLLAVFFSLYYVISSLSNCEIIVAYQERVF